MCRHRASWLPLVGLLGLYWFFLYTLPTPIADEVFYIPAGQLLLSGGNPAMVNPEHPPLAKYLIGLSQAVFFGNARVVGGIVASIAFGTLFHFLRRSENERIASVTAILLMMNPLFLTAMSTATLEVYWISFAVLGFIAVVSRKANCSSLAMAGMLFGCAVASKLAAFPFVFAMVVYLAAVTERSALLRYLPSLLLPIAAVYLATHFVAIAALGAAGFVSYQLSVLQFQESGAGSGVIYPAVFRLLEAPLMAFLGFTNYQHPSNYVPNVFAFGTYWRPTAYLNPALWGLTFPAIGVAVHRLRRKSRNDAFWLLLFVAGLSVTWLSPKFFLYYLDGFSVPLAVLVARSMPHRVLPAYLALAILTVALLSLPWVGPSSYLLVPPSFSFQNPRPFALSLLSTSRSLPASLTISRF